jgi:YHS domain-containing protein
MKGILSTELVILLLLLFVCSNTIHIEMLNILRIGVSLFLCSQTRQIKAESSPEIVIKSPNLSWNNNGTSGQEVLLQEGEQTYFFCSYSHPVRWRVTGALVGIEQFAN